MNLRRAIKIWSSLDDSHRLGNVVCDDKIWILFLRNDKISGVYTYYFSTKIFVKYPTELERLNNYFNSKGERIKNSDENIKTILDKYKDLLLGDSHWISTSEPSYGKLFTYEIEQSEYINLTYTDTRKADLFNIDELRKRKLILCPKEVCDSYEISPTMRRIRNDRKKSTEKPKRSPLFKKMSGKRRKPERLRMKNPLPTMVYNVDIEAKPTKTTGERMYDSDEIREFHAAENGVEPCGGCGEILCICSDSEPS